MSSGFPESFKIIYKRPLETQQGSVLQFRFVQLTEQVVNRVLICGIHLTLPCIYLSLTSK